MHAGKRTTYVNSRAFFNLQKELAPAVKRDRDYVKSSLDNPQADQAHTTKKRCITYLSFIQAMYT